MSRRGSLTPQVIAAAALRLGDREGPEAMSMRRIAGELGCDPMALYRHFPDRQTLLDAVADLALADVPALDQGDGGGGESWQERLYGQLTAIRAAALRHPGIAGHVAARPPLRENGQRLSVAVLATLGEAGLAPADVVRTAQTLVAYVAAALAMAVQAGQRDARWHAVSQTLNGLPGGLWMTDPKMSDRVGSLPSNEDARQGDSRPGDARPGDELFIVGSDEQFEYGLRLLIAGIDAKAAGRSG